MSTPLPSFLPSSSTSINNIPTVMQCSVLDQQGIYRSVVLQTPPLLERPDLEDGPSVNCTFDLLRCGNQKFSQCHLFGKQIDGKYVYTSFEETYKRVQVVARALRDHYHVEKGDRIGIYAKNRKEWWIASLAGSLLGAATVALYDNLDPNNIEYVINHAETQVVFCTASNMSNLETVFPKLQTKVKAFVIMQDTDYPVDAIDTAPGSSSSSSSSTIPFISMSELESQGVVPDDETSQDLVADHATLDDLAQIMYTSGTTGTPKGVMISNRNILAEVGSLCRFALFHKMDVGAGDVSFSFLPLAHIFEQVIELAYMYLGAAIAFSCGDTRKLMDDIKLSCPTILPAVPRVLTRIESAIKAQVAAKSAFVQKLFYFALAQQQKWIKAGGFHNRSTILDKLIFNPIKNAFLPRLKFIFSGSAPLPGPTQSFLEIVMNSYIIEGYGATETTGAITATNPSFATPGLVGMVLPSVEIKLRDVPEMDYFTTDKPCPRGEVMARGPIIFKAYYKNEQATNEAFDEDGFYATGDVGSFNENGALAIIDRKKNIFKLAQGEYVAVEKVEAVYERSNYVLQIWVYGDSKESTLVAVVVPEKKFIKQWCQDFGITEEQIPTDPQVASLVIKDFDALAKEFKLPGFERIRACYVETNISADGMGFTVENGLLTPSFKLKRPALKKYYLEQLTQMYAQINSKDSS